jgi:type II secretory pathway pseudopilin PulG
MLFKHSSDGFTALELLIVGAVFGLLLTLGALSVSSARAKMRDAVRVSDVNTIRAALNVYWQQRATYPVSTGENVGQAGTNTEVFSQEGFVAAGQAKAPFFLTHVPVGPNTNEFYWYKGGPNGYALRFVTEKDSSLGSANVYYAHSNTIDLSDELK